VFFKSAAWSWARWRTVSISRLRSKNSRARCKNLILYGNPPSNLASKSNGDGPGGKARRVIRKEFRGLHFQGVVGFLEHSFEESNSDNYREWITQYMSPRARARSAANGVCARKAWR